MISYQRYGYRMIGTVGRVRRSMGAAATDSFFQGGSTSGGPLPGQQSGEFAAPPPPRVVTLQLAPRTVAAYTPPIPRPVQTTAPSLPTMQDACPPCDCSGGKLGAAVAGALGGGLLMWIVGMATKERKARRRRR